MDTGNKIESCRNGAGDDSIRAKILRKEAEMNEVFTTVLWKFASKLEKKREVPSQSGSIWDYEDPNSLKRPRKNSAPTRENFFTSKNVDACVRLRGLEYYSCDSGPSEPYVDELFPALQTVSNLRKFARPTPIELPSDDSSNDENKELVSILGAPLNVQEREDFLSISRSEMPATKSKAVSVSGTSGSKYQTKEYWSRQYGSVERDRLSFEEWSRHRLEKIPVKEMGKKVLAENTMQYPSVPLAKNDPCGPCAVKTQITNQPPVQPFDKKLSSVENNYFYGILEDVNNIEDASESDLPDDESVISVDIEEPPSVTNQCSVPDFLKMMGYGLYEAPSSFYGINKNPAGFRVWKSKNFNVGGFKQFLSKGSRFFINGKDFLTVKVSDSRAEEELVCLGFEILEIKNFFPLVFKLISAANYQGVAVPFSNAAVSVIIRYALQSTYRLTDFLTAMEVYKLAWVMQLPVLQQKVEQYFHHNPISSTDVMAACAFADDLCFREMLNKVFVETGKGDPTLLKKGAFSFAKRTCLISYSFSRDSQEKGEFSSVKQTCPTSTRDSQEKGEFSSVKQTFPTSSKDLQGKGESSSVKQTCPTSSNNLQGKGESSSVKQTCPTSSNNPQGKVESSSVKQTCPTSSRNPQGKMESSSVKRACLTLSKDPQEKKGEFSSAKRTCLTVNMDPQEMRSLCIPLVNCNVTGDLASIKRTDFQNQVEIEAMRDCELSGVEMCFASESSDTSGHLASEREVQLSCEVFRGKKRIYEEEKAVKIAKSVVLMFKHKITVNAEKISMHIVIEDVKSSYFCFCINETSCFDDGNLKVSLSTNNKNSLKKPLYFINRVFY